MLKCTEWSGPESIKLRQAHAWSPTQFSAIDFFCKSETEIKSELI